MNYKQLISKEVEEINKEIMREVESLKTQTYSSKLYQKSHPRQDKQQNIPSKILQLKPSSKGHKKFTLSQLHIANKAVKPATKYSDKLQPERSHNNKENIVRNQVQTQTSQTKARFCSSSKLPKHSGEIRSSLKMGISVKQHQSKNYQKQNQFYNPNHYASEHIPTDNLFDLSNVSSDSDPLFPDDSLEFQLRQQNPKQSTNLGNKKKQSSVTPKKNSNDFIELIKVANRKSEFKKKQTQKPVQYTFKPTILDKSKQIADRLGPSYARLTARSKNLTKQNTYREVQPVKTYSRERMNTLSRPRMVTEEIQPEVGQECTFKPVLSKKSLSQFNACEMDVVQRNTLWQYQRQKRLLKRKQEEQINKNQKLKSECSAVKMKSNYKPDRQVSLSKFGKEGLIGYFQRISQASNMKKRQKQMQNKFNGQRWNGSVTKPQQFRLSSNSPNQLSFRSRGKSVNNTSVQNPVQSQYDRAMKEVRLKIQNLNLYH